jgi:hypothetical protein
MNPSAACLLHLIASFICILTIYKFISPLHPGRRTHVNYIIIVVLHLYFVAVFQNSFVDCKQSNIVNTSKFDNSADREFFVFFVVS